MREVVGEEKMVPKLAGRTQCDLEKAGQVGVGAPAAALGDVGRNGAQDRRIWLFKPYCSSQGSVVVASWAAKVSRWLPSQTPSCVRSRILRIIGSSCLYL